MDGETLDMMLVQSQGVSRWFGTSMVTADALCVKARLTGRQSMPMPVPIAPGLAPTLRLTSIINAKPPLTTSVSLVALPCKMKRHSRAIRAGRRMATLAVYWTWWQTLIFRCLSGGCIAGSGTDPYRGMDETHDAWTTLECIP